MHPITPCTSTMCVDKSTAVYCNVFCLLQCRAIRDLQSDLHNAHLQLSRNEDESQSVTETTEQLYEAIKVSQAGSSPNKL
jgi:hypothetical protein